MLKEFNPPKDVEKEALKEEIKALRERLLAQQQLVRSSNLPVIVLVEGWAAAGKGSLINELINEIDPRFYNVVSPVSTPQAEARYPFLFNNNGVLALDCGELIPYPDEVPQEARSGGYDLGVRPNDIVFDDNSSLKARVDSRVFLGSEYNYFLSLGQKQIRVQQSMLDARTKGIAEEGETVGIRLLNPRFYPTEKGGKSA